MISPKSSTILDKIKKEYEYAIDPLDFENTSLIKYYYETIREKVSFDWDEITHTLMPIIDDYKKI